MRERFTALSLRLSPAWKEWQLPTPVVEDDTEHPLVQRAKSPSLTPPTTLDVIAEEDETAITPQAPR